jgi:hypothetical protein
MLSSLYLVCLHPLRKMLHIQYLGKFEMYLHGKLYNFSFSRLIIIAIKRNYKYRLHADAMLLNAL